MKTRPSQNKLQKEMIFLEDYIWLFWDIAAAVIIIFCVRICARRGLLRTVISFFSYFIAAVAAKLLCPVAAGVLYDYIIRDAIVVFVNGELGDTIASGRDFAAKLLESFPKFLQSYLPLPEELVNMGGYAAMGTREIVEGIVDSAIKAPVLVLMQSLCFMVIFSFVLLISRFIARMFSEAYRIPLIGPINTFMGGVLGLLQAVIILLVASFMLSLAIVLSGDSLEWLNDRIMDETYIWRVFFLLVAK